MVALSQDLLALIVGDPGRAVEHQADQGLGPLGVSQSRFLPWM
jgi:hypothetical protein